jgi:hypothetical protein
MAMSPFFHLPWSTFSSILVLLGTILLALVWAWFDKQHDRKDG